MTDDGHDRTGNGTVVTLEHSRVILTVHDAALCAGRPCTVHNRTDHHMRAWPQHWRADRGLMERVCPHGVGHPDPDSPWPLCWPEWVHGCDGCCALPTEEAVDG